MNAVLPQQRQFRRTVVVFAVSIAVIAVIVTLALGQKRARPRFEGKSATEWLLSFDNDANRRPQLEAARAAYEALGTNALPELIAILRERPNSPKQRLLGLAQRFRLIPQQPYLPEVQWRAAQVCSWIGWNGGDIRAAVPVLERHLWENSRNDAVEYARALATAGNPGKQALLRCVNGPSVPTCEAAAMELQPFKGDVAVVNALVLATTNAAARVRMRAYMALRGKAPVEPRQLVATALLRGLSDADGSARWFAAEAAANYLDQPGVVAALEQARTDPKPEVQRAAERALKQAHAR